MATSGTISGTFSGKPVDHHYPYIYWSISQNIAGNYSDVTAVLHFVRVGVNYSYNLSTHTNTGNIDGTGQYSGDSDFDTRPGVGDYTIRTITQRVYHNADGTRTCWIGWDGNTNTSLGTYNFGATVTLDTIPRSATLTNVPVFSLENAFNMTFYNPASFYVKVRISASATNGSYSVIGDYNAGAVGSYNLTLTAGNKNSIYALIPNQTVFWIKYDLYTYSDSGYTTLIGSNSYSGYYYTINTTINKPTFTTYTLENIDEALVNTDKYSQALITSNTNTLTGSSAKMINGYNQVRATVSDANKMTPLNSATALKYRFANGLIYADNNSPFSYPETIDINDVLANSFSVTAYDSRNLTTVASINLTSTVAYTPTSLWDLSFVRDNSVDAPTKLVISGSYWYGYFGGGSSGVQNTVTAHYRYKETTESWEGKSGTCTISNATPCVVTKTSHGFADGDKVWFMTTGSLPTGITAVTTQYYAKSTGANTFNLYDTYAHAIAGGATGRVNTSSAGSGTHTVRAGVIWTSLTLSDTSGSLSFNDYINGDLGASGFDTEKSFNVEVRIYDKLTNYILEATLDVGIPVLDMVQAGIAIKAKYDDGVGGALQVTGNVDIIGDTSHTGSIAVNGYDYLDEVYNYGGGEYVDLSSLASSWINYEGYTGTYLGAGYYKDPLGFVKFHGLIKNGTFSSTIWTQEIGARTYGNELFACSAVDVLQRVDINGSGSVYIQGGGNNAFVSLAQVYYSTFIKGWTSPSLTNGWVAYDATDTWGTVGYYKDRFGWVHLRGIVKNAGTNKANTSIFTLPVGYRPSQVSVQTDVFETGGGNQAGNIVIGTDGTVVWNGSNSAVLFASLSGISFLSSTSPYDALWQGGTYSNNWVASGNGLQWLYTPDGYVSFRGAIINGTTASGTTCFTMSNTAYAPIGGHQIYTVPTASNYGGTVMIGSNGVCYVRGNASASGVFFDGIRQRSNFGIVTF